MSDFIGFVWLSIRMILVAVILVCSAVLGLPWLFSGKTAYMGILKGVDDVCGSIFFLEFERTVSGILGEGQFSEWYGFDTWAKIVDWLFYNLGIDDKRHCFFNYVLEVDIENLRTKFMRMRNKYARENSPNNS